MPHVPAQDNSAAFNKMRRDLSRRPRRGQTEVCNNTENPLQNKSTSCKNNQTALKRKRSGNNMPAKKTAEKKPAAKKPAAKKPAAKKPAAKKPAAKKK